MQLNGKQTTIWFILGYPSTHRGGIEIFAYRCARALARFGFTVKVACRHDGDLAPAYREFSDRFIVLQSLASKIKILGMLLLESVRFRKTFVYGHHPNGLFMLWMMSRISRSTFVFHFHLPPCPLSRSQRFALLRADCLIFVSKATEDAWRSQLPLDHIRREVVHNGADTETFSPPDDSKLAKAKLGISEQLRVVSFVGRFDRQKGLHVLIRAFDQAFPKAERSDVRLVIYGGIVIDGEGYEQELHRLVEDLNRQESIEFCGRTNRPQDVYQASDLFVIPSIWPDPQPLSVTEALATGVPVIGSRIGGIPEMLSGEFDRFLFEPENVADLARKLREHIDWRESDPLLGDRCREWVKQRFTLASCMEKIQKILLESKS